MENEVKLEMIDKNETVIAEKKLMILTDKLPDSMNDLVQVKKKTEKSAMKLILAVGKSMPYPAAFDEQGDIRYMMRFRPRGYGFFPVANDRFIVMERQTLLPHWELLATSRLPPGVISHTSWCMPLGT